MPPQFTFLSVVEITFHPNFLLVFLSYPISRQWLHITEQHRVKSQTMKSQSMKLKMNRRRFLGTALTGTALTGTALTGTALTGTALAGAALLPALPAAVSAALQPNSRQQDNLFINGHIDSSGKHYVSGFNVRGDEQFRLAIPDEAHGFAVDPTAPNRIVSAPSVNGTHAVVMDAVTGKQLAIIKSRPGRHYLGHAMFSPDGRFLFTSENIIDTAEGIITVRDGRDFRFLRELSAYGIGPHDMRLLPDGFTLVVASGGIRTQPTTGRQELNLSSLKSALLYIDSRNGKLLQRREVPVPQLSIRHIDVAAEGEVLVACQYKGRIDMPALVGLQQGTSEIEMLNIDDDNLWAMRGYTASACIAPNGVGAVSCPRGNQLSLWDLRKKALIKLIEIKDVGGVAVSADGQRFIVSANVGELYQVDTKSLQVKQMGAAWKNAQWTNHMLRTLV